MKQKDKSIPPSKKKNSSPSMDLKELEELSASARRDFEAAQERLEKKTEPYKKDVERAHDEYRASLSNLRKERAFQNTLDRASKELNISRDELEGAFKDNKPSLSVKFNTRSRRKNHMRQGYPLLGMSISMTSVLSYLASESHPALFLFPALFGTASLLVSAAIVSDKKAIIDAEKEIKAKTIEYKENKQLPSPK
jgi:hypothetical protein